MAATAGVADHYRVLGLHPGAPEAEVRGAYRRLVRSLHPDANPGAAAATARFAEVVAARRAIAAAAPAGAGRAGAPPRHVDVYA